jgi:hypothetical protein
VTVELWRRYAYQRSISEGESESDRDSRRLHMEAGALVEKAERLLEKAWLQWQLDRQWNEARRRWPGIKEHRGAGCKSSCTVRRKSSA